MPTNRNRVRSYYDHEHDEWGRLESELGAYEWATATRRLAQFLPPPPARVLDIGGGPGRYAIWLAERGYEVTLVDLSPHLVEQAASRAQARGLSFPALVGDATDLSAFPDNSFDTAISLGPFYHLVDAGERARAADELIRVSKPGALVAIMLLNRAAGFFDCLASGQTDLFTPGHEATWERIFTEGIYENPKAESEGLFVDNYSVWPSDALPEVERYGFVTEALVGCEGPLVRFGHALQIATAEPDVWEFLWRQAYRFEEHPDFLILSPHLLWLGRSPS